MAIKAKLEAEQDRIIKLQAFVSSYFRGKSHFVDAGTQNYFLFQQMYRHFRSINNNTDYITRWKSTELSDEVI